VIKHLTYIVV